MWSVIGFSSHEIQKLPTGMPYIRHTYMCRCTYVTVYSTVYLWQAVLGHCTCNLFVMTDLMQSPFGGLYVHSE